MAKTEDVFDGCVNHLANIAIFYGTAYFYLKCFVVGFDH